ncbi:GNAT family N-acetyltransferase [Photobacterium sp. 2_MG-2023]|uniref:GNAT family N-acetyltransferase n=1 Tax=Photobacterium sp. 2_MG-2023 TaxID=3062663 RepID=UPI0034A535AD
MWIRNEKLEGQWVILEPLEEVHIGPLKKAVSDGDSWKLWFASVPTSKAMSDYVNRAMLDARAGNIAYAVRLKSSGEIVGTTRYYNVDETNRRAMIGYTWYSDSVKRTPVNTECKYLLLKRFFEDSDAIAVEFRKSDLPGCDRTPWRETGRDFAQPSDHERWLNQGYCGVFDHCRRVAGGESESAQ